MRYFYLLLTAGILFVLAGCGGTTAESPAPAAVDPADLPALVDVETVAAIKDRDDVMLIDVREPEEYAAGHIAEGTLIPMGQVPERLSEIPTDKTVILYCRSGNRSGQVMQLLQAQGYTNVHNMEGGMLAWELAKLPVE